MTILALILFFAAQAASGTLQVPELLPPTRTAPPLTPAENPIIREGVALFDQGKYDEALARFDQILKANPDNVIAIYEMAKTLSRKNEPQKAIDLAARGTQYLSPVLPQLYALIGNVLDASREPQKALDVYKKGLALNIPNTGILYVNMGVTHQTSLRDVASAKTSFKQGILSDPNYPGNHLQLANIYGAQGLKTAVLMAFGRFLVLEPGSNRSPLAYVGWRAMLENGPTPVPPQGHPLYAYITSSTQTGEGDLTQLDAALVSSKAAAVAPGKSQIQALVDQVDNLFGTYATLQPGDDKDTFLWKVYLPWAIEMKQKGYVEPFVYFLNQRTNLPGVREWLTANRDKVDTFLLWSRTYRWPDKNSVDATR
ncbi:MAG TPA: tetratricopeptide repeat protein [Terriglobia bacterium]|nr:tetratricopeptide repeat protein [Terriglobia bacterium]